MPATVERPFRFGATLLPVETATREWRDSVRVAEQAGFSVVTVMDHFRSGGIWAALAAANHAAPSLRIGTLVLNNDLWHPLLLAREAITTDLLSDGKLELGLGAGWDLEDYGAMRLERAPASVRIERLTEALAILRQACAGQSPTFHGAHYSVDAIDDWPRPRQPRIPLLVGGGGKGVLALAATAADIVSISRNLQRGMAASWRPGPGEPGGSSDGITERVRWIRESAGDRFGELELHCVVSKALVTGDRLTVAAAIGRPLGLEGEQVLASPHFLIGTVEEIAEDLEQRRDRWGISYWTLSSANTSGGNDMQQFAPVIERLRGR